jgi:hypothetical protein
MLVMRVQGQAKDPRIPEVRPGHVDSLEASLAPENLPFWFLNPLESWGSLKV